MTRREKTRPAQAGITQTQLALRRLRRHKLAISSLWVLGFLYLVALFADFIAPYGFDDERRDLSYCPPMRLHFFDEAGTFHIRPFVYQYSYTFDEYFNRVYVQDRSVRFPVKAFVQGTEHRLMGFIPMKMRLLGVDEPARVYLLGADYRGRDLLSRIIYGSRVSLSIGFVGVAVSFTVGMLVGGISGFFGGRTDNVLMRMCEMVMMIPGFYLMLALRAAFPPGLSSVEVYLMIVLIMSFIGWAGLARVIRGMVLSIREKEFVTAARASGEGSLRIIIRHVLPNTLSYVIVAVTLSIPGYILGESALSLIGVGIQEPYASWGNLLTEAMKISAIQFHPWILIPGLLIFIAVMAFNFLGDGLRDAFDPKLAFEGE
ncbi:MAG: ABC transporter permease [Candidatus Abyssobacteria bacterium SURF_17]|uniref:ABC transporter permease n=1 Tax=Candidatus Abyssobacteria bacterium SURF_17 TaxID=2093361 RepID=A0A419F540_9BACT|nr:MAG: ABC transporter permease [Candidatus Abyssubacteria bacterium SURF_17]